MLPADAFKAVVPGEAAVHKCEIRVDQITDSEILRNEFDKEQLRLFGHRPAQQLVVLGIEFLIRCCRINAVEPKPLA